MSTCMYVVEGVDKSDVARNGWMKLEQVMEQWGEMGREKCMRQQESGVT